MDSVAPRWYASSNVRLLFSISAYLSVTLILVVVLLLALDSFVSPTTFIRITESILAQAIDFLLGLIAAPAAIFLWLGMLWHARAERMPLAWLSFLILGSWLVAPLYYRFVFRQSAVAPELL